VKTPIPFATAVFALLLGTVSGFAQSFTNLDFESANLSGYSAGSVPAADAIPGWTAYFGGVLRTNISYNVSPVVVFGGDILGTNGGYHPFQGSYYYYLLGSGSSPAVISQSGTVPVTARSLTFMSSTPAWGGVSFNGQILSLWDLGRHVYGADISGFAGETGELRFESSAYPGGLGYLIDNIQFSDQPIPEPGTLGLVALGGLALAGARRVRRFVT